MSMKQQPLTERFSRSAQAKLVFEGALVGLTGGAAVVLYRRVLSWAEGAMRAITSWAQSNLFFIVLWFVVLAALVFIVGKLMLYEPYTQGSGIPQTDAEAIGRLDMPWYKVMWTKFVEGTLCCFGGLSLGREGPSVMLGGMSGKAVSKLFHKDRGIESLFVTCGAAAGMAAAFHAPLTGVLFAVEEIHKVFSASLVMTAMSSAVVSDFLVSQVLGMRPTLNFQLIVNNLPHTPNYVLVILMGIYCGFLGALHNKGMFGCQKLYGKIHSYVPYTRIAIPFALAGIIAFTAPDLMCGGDAIIERLQNPYALSIGTIIFLLVGKYLFTTISFASGAPGGTLFPLVVMGSLSGALFCRILGFFGVSEMYMMNFIYLGIAGLFAGVVRAPVTAIVLVFELTGSLDTLLSVSIVSMLAFVTANLLDVDPFYEHLLKNLLGTLPGDAELKKLHGVSMRTYNVTLNSLAAGKAIRDIPWPNNTHVILVERAGAKIAPQGGTVLEPTDTITVLINRSNLASAEQELTDLCRPQAFVTTDAVSPDSGSESPSDKSK